jgi:hypothetical protein
VLFKPSVPPGALKCLCSQKFTTSLGGLAETGKLNQSVRECLASSDDQEIRMRYFLLGPGEEL